MTRTLTGYGDRFLQPLFRNEDRIFRIALTLFRECAWFDTGECRYFSKGDALLEEGVSNRGMVIVIESGYAHVTKRGAQGREALLRFCVPGDLIGEQGLLGHGQWAPASSISVTAITDGRAHVMPVDEMRNLIKSQPGGWQLLAKYLSVRLSEADALITTLACPSAEIRLARVCYELMCHGGIVLGDGSKQLPIHVASNRVAMWIGVSTRTVEHILQKWRDRHIIARQARPIIVYNLEKMRSLARL
jgi:CRP-like cAMP-binding protein